MENKEEQGGEDHGGRIGVRSSRKARWIKEKKRSRRVRKRRSFVSTEETTSTEKKQHRVKHRTNVSSTVDFRRVLQSLTPPSRSGFEDAEGCGTKKTRGSKATTRLVEILAMIGSFLLMIATLPFSLCFAFKVVQEYERAVVFRMGRLKGDAYGPGTFFVVPCVDECIRVDLRTVSFDVPPQEILTKDSVTVSVDAVVYYRIKEPLSAVVKIANYRYVQPFFTPVDAIFYLALVSLCTYTLYLCTRLAIRSLKASSRLDVIVGIIMESHSTRLLAASTLRTVLGTRSLAEILSERETISHTMQSSLDEATDPWGVKVERVEIKDVRLPVQLQRAMATEAEATREAQAKVIAAEGEMRASHALKEASDVISTSPAALQLRYLQTLNNISAEKNSTIVFPLPVELLTPFFTASQCGFKRDETPPKSS